MWSEEIWRARRDLNPQPSDPKLAPTLNGPKPQGKEALILKDFRLSVSGQSLSFFALVETKVETFLETEEEGGNRARGGKEPV